MQTAGFFGLLQCRGLVLLPLLLTYSSEALAADATVRVRVVDDATGELLPARLAIKTSDGRYPGDRLGASAEQWPHLEAHGVFIRGTHEFTVPAGKTEITAACGLQYEAASRSIDARTNRAVDVELRLKRLVDLRSLGWVCGDLHVHMIHGEQQRETSYEDIALSCEAGGLDFVSVGQEYVGAGTLDLAGYHAKCKEVSHDRFQMFLGGERPKNILGHQVLLGCENPFVISEEAPYFKSAAAIRAQGGVSVFVHPLRYYPGKEYNGQLLDFPGNNLARELIFDAYCGPSFDGLSVLSDEPANEAAHRLWFNLLNRGMFVPVFGDSDACFDRPTLGLKAPGLWNTYFYIGPGTELTQHALVDAVRSGRTFATTGPLVQFSIDEEISGATLPSDGVQRELKIRVDYSQHAFSLDQIDPKSGQKMGVARVELIRNGQIVESWTPATSRFEITRPILEKERAWYIVRAFGTDERWQVALTSPIYFAEKSAAKKQPPRSTLVRGRIYDFRSGDERVGTVEVRRHGEVLKRFDAAGQFRVRMPIDAEITVEAEGARPITKDLLMDYGPVHRFLWHLESADLSKPETLDRFEFLTRSVDLEFAIGQILPGCFIAQPLDGPTELKHVRVVSGPIDVQDGSVAIAAVLTDAERIAPGETLHVAAIFRDEGSAGELGPYVVEARGYDPQRPTAFGALKRFGGFEASWDNTVDLGNGYRLIAGELAVPSWVEHGPTGAIDLSVRVRDAHGDAAFLGLAVPLGETQRELAVASSWPTMPISWPDRSYGIGPLKVCNRIGRKAQPKGDYRKLELEVDLHGKKVNLLPARDGRGCADADDAMYAEHFLDQVLNEEFSVVKPEEVRAQPAVVWREDLQVVDATQ